MRNSTPASLSELESPGRGGGGGDFVPLCPVGGLCAPGWVKLHRATNQELKACLNSGTKCRSCSNSGCTADSEIHKSGGSSTGIC